MMSGEGTWTVTFSDMLTLLLTFFVFIIAVSVFRTPEYKEFWERYDHQAQMEQKKAATKSFRFELIKGLKFPRLNADAEKMLTNLESTFDNSDYVGANVYCDENKISMMISEQLSFEAGEFELKEEVKPFLQKLIPSINQTKFDICIEGHTDTEVSQNLDNVDLSLKRALSVARFLIKHGVDQRKISVAGYGPYRPAVSNLTQEGRKRNRRVEINIMINND